MFLLPCEYVYRNHQFHYFFIFQEMATLLMEKRAIRTTSSYVRSDAGASEVSTLLCMQCCEDSIGLHFVRAALDKKNKKIKKTLFHF